MGTWTLWAKGFPKQDLQTEKPHRIPRLMEEDLHLGSLDDCNSLRFGDLAWCKMSFINSSMALKPFHPNILGLLVASRKWEKVRTCIRTEWELGIGKQSKASHLNTLKRLNPKLSIPKPKPSQCARHETLSRVTRGACCCCQPGELSTQACFTGRSHYSSALAKNGESREKGMDNNLESGCLYGGLTPVVCTRD